MLDDLEARGERLAEAARLRAITDGVTRLRAALPGVAVTPAPDGIVLAGRALADDPRLVWLGSLWR